MLFQYAIIYNPSKEQKDKGDVNTIIQDITSILSPDQNSALLKIARKIPEDYLDRLEQVEITVRPF